MNIKSQFDALMINHNTIMIDNLNQTVEVAFNNEAIPIGLFSSDEYAPACGILIESIIEQSNNNNRYDILVLESEISERNKQFMLELINSKSNISIRFINIKNIIKLLDITPRNYFSVHNVTKIFYLSPIFSKYNSIICLDSDLILMHDISDLYHSFDTRYSMAAVIDVQMKVLVNIKRKSSGSYAGENAGDYIKNRLGMDNTDNYFNTGVCVINLDLCRPLFKEMIDKVNSATYWFMEQDVLNMYLWKNATELDPKWNCMVTADRTGIKTTLGEEVYSEYMKQIEEAYVIHYAGANKPWKSMLVPESAPFINYSNNTPWNYLIANNLIKNLTTNVYNDYKQIASLNARIQQLEVAQKQIASLNARIQQLEVAQKQPIKITIRRKIRTGALILSRKTLSDKYYNLLWQQYGRVCNKRFWKTRRQSLDNVLIYKKTSKIKKSIEYESKRKIQYYKNKYYGKRCFIIGNGPSLKSEDLDKIRNEISFGLNDIYKIFPKTEWKPTFYYNNKISMQYSIPKGIDDKSIVFVDSTKYNEEIGKKNNDYNIIFIPKINCNTLLYQPKKSYWSNDCSKKIVSYGTLYTIMQIVAYMGFKEVYLMGMDCDYSGKPHFYEDSQETKEYYTINQQRLQDAKKNEFKMIANHTNKIGIQIFNATNGGQLNTFERVSINSINGII